MTQDFDTLTDDEFRNLWREWLAANYPAEWRRPITLRLRGEQEQRWLRMLYDHGWRLPAWPKEHGGMGLGFSKQLIYHQELEDFGAARFLDSGGSLLGPILIKYGTEAQKAKYLPKICTGEELWCQGYSEPNAGSDLASLRTTAALNGDHFVVNGQKTWTTMVAEAVRMFLLVRTRTDGKKQAGISFLLMDMDTPGVTVRPIMNLAGEDEFGEVFLEDVRIPRENLVHELNDGWTVAKTLLGAERFGNGAPMLPAQAIDILDQLVMALELDNDPALQARRAQLLCDLNDHSALYEGVSDAAIRGDDPGVTLNVLKVHSSELFQRVSDTIMEIVGEDAGSAEATAVAGVDADLHKIFMIARPASIYAGANEVQRDMIARALMGKLTR